MFHQDAEAIAVAVQRQIFAKAEQIRFYGDFMAAASMDAVTAALTGCQFRPEAFGKVLDGFDLPVYFGGVTKDEILQTIFDTQA